MPCHAVLHDITNAMAHGHTSINSCPLNSIPCRVIQLKPISRDVTICPCFIKPSCTSPNSHLRTRSHYTLYRPYLIFSNRPLPFLAHFLSLMVYNFIAHHSHTPLLSFLFLHSLPFSFLILFPPSLHPPPPSHLRSLSH